MRFLRENKNWSQEEMADRLGMSTNGYSKIERGETRLTIPKLEQIADILEVDILELISLGEKNIVFFQESDNNMNIIGSSHEELAVEIKHLKQAINYKNEIISSKNEIISQKDALLKAKDLEIRFLKQQQE